VRARTIDKDERIRGLCHGRPNDDRSYGRDEPVR
jgi:hypothetical protein